MSNSTLSSNIVLEYIKQKLIELKGKNGKKYIIIVGNLNLSQQLMEKAKGEKGVLDYAMTICSSLETASQNPLFCIALGYR